MQHGHKLGVIGVLCVMAADWLFAAPFEKEFDFRQPDGRVISLWGRGDEFHAIFETRDGYSVVFDPASKSYVYAVWSRDAETLLPSQLRVGRDRPELLRLPKHLRIRPEAAARQARQKFQEWDRVTQLSQRWQQCRRSQMAAAGSVLPAPALAPSEASTAPLDATQSAPPSFSTNGTRVGLCLLIDFDDAPATIPKSTIEDFCNGDNYTGFGSYGSVKRYFYDNSGGGLTYTNVVTAYIRIPNALHPKSYYNDVSKDIGTQANELIRDAIGIMKTLPNYHSEIVPALQALSRDSAGYVLSSNVLFAGADSGVWNKGLWPHAWALYTVGPQELAPGIWFNQYQLSNIGTNLSLGTFCHENGHMLLGFPDLYDYGNDSAGGAGVFCLMGRGSSSTRPAQFCAYLKRAAGWATTVELTRTSALTASVSASGADFNRIYRFAKPGTPTEYFLIENRQQSGWDASLPGSGVAIWHIDELGDRDNQSTAANTSHANFEVSLEQADGMRQLESYANSGDGNDLFFSGNATTGYANRFRDASNPSARWWDGSNSGIDFRSFSARAATMTFTVASTVSAADGIWVASTDGNWSTAANWQGSKIADGKGRSATFAPSASRTVTLDGVRSIGALVFDGADHTLTGGTMLLEPNSGNVSLAVGAGRTATIRSILDGSAGLTKSGAGTATLAAVNRYRGGTVVDAGRLEIMGSGGGSGNLRGGVTIQPGAELRYVGGDGTGFGYNEGSKIDELNIVGGQVVAEGGCHIWNLALHMTGGSLHSDIFQWNRVTTRTRASADSATISGMIALRGDWGFSNSRFEVEDGTAEVDLSVPAAIHGNGVAISKEGRGRMRMTGTSNYDGGTSILAGTLEITGRSADNGGYTSIGTGPVTIHPGATLLSSSDWTTGNAWNTGSVGKITVLEGGKWMITGAAATVHYGLELQGGSVLSNGQVNRDWGVLHLRSQLTAAGDAVSYLDVDTALGGSCTVHVASGSRLECFGSIHNQIQTDGAIRKTGGGIMVIRGDCGYTGITQVEEGRMQVDGRLAATSALTVSNGATLCGSGEVTGPVSLGSGAIIAAGKDDTPGHLHTGALAIAAGARAIMRVGALSDRLEVSGNLAISGTIALQDVGAARSGCYPLISFTGTRAGLPQLVAPAGFSASLDTSTPGLIAVNLQANRYDTWLRGFLTAEELADPSVSGVHATPAGDGVGNLLKYALGLSPKTMHAGAVLVVERQSIGMVATYQRPADRSDVTYFVEVSSDLLHWDSEGVTHRRIVAGELETWQANLPASPVPARFVRLRVSAP